MEQLPEIREEQLVIEEEQRNTAPAIAYASHIIQKLIRMPVPSLLLPII